MLQRLNERLQGVIAWIVIVFIAITFTLFGVDYYMQSRQSSTSIAEVNGQSISKGLFSRLYERLRGEEGAKITAERDAALKKQVLDELILRTVIVQSAKKAGFSVSPEQAQAAIFTIPQLQENGRFSMKRYQQALNAMMLTRESFQQEIEQNMLGNQQRFAFIGSAFVLDTEVERYAQLLYETRDYRYLILPVSSFSKKVHVSEQQVHEYYLKNKAEFKTPMQLSVTYVLLSLEKIKSQTYVSAEAIEQRYRESNTKKPLSEIRAEIEAQLLNEQAQLAYSQALEQLTELSYQNPDSLEPVAKALNLPVQRTAPFSREGGKDTLTQNADLLRSAFSRDVRVLKNNSEPVQMDNSSVIVLRVDKQFPEAYQSFNEVKEKIEKQLAFNAAKQAAEQEGQRLLAHQPNSLLKTLSWQTVSKAKRDVLGSNAAVQSLAFRIAKKGQMKGQSLPNGDYAIVQLEEIHPGDFKALDQAQKESLKHQLESTYGRADYDLYVDYLLGKAKIREM